MARPQQPDGRIVSIQTGAWSIGEEIRVSNDYTRGLDDLSRNCNTIWAQRSPPVVSQHLQGVWNSAMDLSAREIKVYEADAFGAGNPPRFYYVVRFGPYGRRNTLGGRVLCSAVGEPGIEVQLQSVGGSATVTTITGSGWADLDPVQLNAVAPGCAIVGVSFRRMNGGAYAQALELFLEPWVGDLDPVSPSFIVEEPEGFIPLDEGHFEADNPFSAHFIQMFGTNHEALWATREQMVTAHAVDNRLEGDTVGGVAVPWWTGNPYSVTPSERTSLVRFLYHQRAGEEATHLGFAFLPFCGNTAGDAEIRVHREGGGGPSSQESYPVTEDFPDPGNVDDWVFGEISLSPAPGRQTITMFAWSQAKPSPPMGLYGWTFWEKR